MELEMPKVQNILGLLGIQHTVLIIKGEKPSVLARNQGSYFGNNLISDPDVTV